MVYLLRDDLLQVLKGESVDKRFLGILSAPSLHIDSVVAEERLGAEGDRQLVEGEDGIAEVGLLPAEVEVVVPQAGGVVHLPGGLGGVGGYD